MTVSSAGRVESTQLPRYASPRSGATLKKCCDESIEPVRPGYICRRVRIIKNFKSGISGKDEIDVSPKNDEVTEGKPKA